MYETPSYKNRVFNRQIPGNWDFENKTNLKTRVVDISDGAQTAARGKERIVGFHTRQLADSTDWHRCGGG